MSKQELPESEFVEPDLKNPDLWHPNLGNLLIRQWPDSKTYGEKGLIHKPGEKDRYVGFVLRAGVPNPERPSDDYVRGDTVMMPSYQFKAVEDDALLDSRLILIAAADVLARVGPKRKEPQDEVQSDD